MKKFFILLGLIVLLSASVLAADVSKVGDWWGTVTINGNTGNNGVVVTAYIDGNKVASATVGQYVSGYYLIHVEGESGDVVLFKVNGKDATTDTWSNGDHRLDLNVNIDYSGNDDSSDDDSSGGGGSTSRKIVSFLEDLVTEEGGVINEEENVNLSYDEKRETTPSITGAVIGNFVKTTVGKTLIILIVIVLIILLYFGIKKYK